jgi:anti-sigma28 factor (negative regulator of flagellin synthesis)
LLDARRCRPTAERGDEPGREQGATMRSTRTQHHGGPRRARGDANRRAPAPGSSPDAARVPHPSTQDPVEEVVDELRAARIRRLRDEIANGTYAPPTEDVAERLAAFFVGSEAIRLPPRSR